MLLRRLGHVFWIPLAVVLTAVLLPFYVVGLVVALVARRMRLLRVVSFALAYTWVDVGLVVGCWLLWVAQPLPGRDETIWRERHAALLGHALKILSVASRSMLGYRVAVDACPVPVSDAPLLVLSRHAGPGDSFSMVQLLLTTFRRRPKVVLKEALQWDPGIDLLLNRLDCYFLPSSTGAGEDRIEAVRDLALSLEPREALLIFPEGGNWTPKRHARAVRWLRRNGEQARAAEAAERRHVLPPRPGGVVATLSARPDLDVVVIAHTGLDLLVSPWHIWEALPIDHQPMSVHWWVTPAAQVPREPDAILDWVNEIWADVDAWVATESEEDHAPILPSITLEAVPESIPVIPVAPAVADPGASDWRPRSD